MSNDLRPINLNDFPDIKEKVVTVIDCALRQFAYGVGDKRALLTLGPLRAADLIAVWTGQHSSHAFAVTDDVLAHWRERLGCTAGDRWMPKTGRERST